MGIVGNLWTLNCLTSYITCTSCLTPGVMSEVSMRSASCVYLAQDNWLRHFLPHHSMYCHKCTTCIAHIVLGCYLSLISCCQALLNCKVCNVNMHPAFFVFCCLFTECLSVRHPNPASFLTPGLMLLQSKQRYTTISCQIHLLTFAHVPICTVAGVVAVRSLLGIYGREGDHMERYVYQCLNFALPCLLAF